MKVCDLFVEGFDASKSPYLFLVKIFFHDWNIYAMSTKIKAHWAKICVTEYAFWLCCNLKSTYNSNNWNRLQYFVRLRVRRLLVWFLIFSHDLTWQTQDAILKWYVRMDASLDEKSSRMADNFVNVRRTLLPVRRQQTLKLGSCNFSDQYLQKRRKEVQFFKVNILLINGNFTRRGNRHISKMTIFAVNISAMIFWT